MRRLFILLLLPCSTHLFPQQITFNEYFESLEFTDVIELPDSTFFVTGRKNHNYEASGVRGFHIDKHGQLLDSISFPAIAPYSGRTGHMTLLQDSTVLSSFYENDDINGRRFYIVRWQIYPALDTIEVKQIYPDSSSGYPWVSFGACEMKLAQDGNILIAGYLPDTVTGSYVRNVGYIAKYDQSLNLLWETTIDIPDTVMRTSEFILEAPDGNFVVSGPSRKFGFTGNNHAWVAKIDSTGNILWEHIFPNFIQSAGNYDIRDGWAIIENSADGNIRLIYTRCLDCGDNGEWCDIPYCGGDIRFMKLDWNGNILSDTFIGPDFVNWGGVISLKSIPSGGYIISGLRFIPTYRAVVFRVSEEGDSIWWREPHIGDYNQDWSIINQTVPTIDGGFAGAGMVLIPTIVPQSVPQKGYVFKLDSNGCFGPGNCHNSILTVEELPAAASGISVYPNPAINEVNIQYTSAHGKHEVILRDMQGKEVRRQLMEELTPGEQKVLLHIQGLAAGQYLIEIHGEKGRKEVVKVKIAH